MKREELRIEGIPAVVWGEPSERAYIYVHGRMGSKEEAESFAEKAARRGHQVLSFDSPSLVWEGVEALARVGAYARQRWGELSLYAGSRGAYFSLLAYRDVPFKKCLFLSPILDMERLIRNMMRWSHVAEAELEEKKIIPTSFGEDLDWKYLCYVKERPIARWDARTAILYGAQDELTEREVVDGFARRFGCDLTVMEGGEHWFHTEAQLAVLAKWEEANL